MRFELIQLLVASSWTWRTTEARRPFTIHFKSTQCLANPKFISRIECSIREINAAPTIYMDVLTAQDAGKLSYDLLIMLPRARQDLVLFEMNALDGCMFLENASSFPLVKIIRNEFKKYSNLPDRCPVVKGTMIKVRGLKIDPENFPSYVPETKFYVRTRMYENGEHFFNMTVNGTCENKRSFFKGWG